MGIEARRETAKVCDMIFASAFVFRTMWVLVQLFQGIDISTLSTRVCMSAENVSKSVCHAIALHTMTLATVWAFDLDRHAWKPKVLDQRIPAEDLAIVVHYNFRAHHHTDPRVRGTKPEAVVRHLQGATELAPLELRQQLLPVQFGWSMKTFYLLIRRHDHH